MASSTLEGDLAPARADLFSARRPSANTAIWAWVALGLAAYLVFPWYALQDGNGLQAIGGVFGAAETANGLMQAASYGRAWLWLGLAGLLVTAVAATRTPGKTQGTLLLAGGLFGTL